MHSRVPSKRVAMVSRKVFCGAIRPLITGIRERVEPRLSLRSEPWLSPGADTKPGRNLDEAPGAPPNPWRRAPSRDTRDSTVQNWPPRPPSRWSQRGGAGEEPLEAARVRTRVRTEGWMEGTCEDGHIYARVYSNAISLSSSPSLSYTNTFFPLNISPLHQQTKQCTHPPLLLPLILWCSHNEWGFKAGK